MQSGNLKPRNDIYLGLRAELLMNDVSEDMKNDVRRYCFNFYWAALNGILKRYNFNDTFLASLSGLNPYNIEENTSVVPLLQLHTKCKRLSSEDIHKIDEEWQDLRPHIKEIPEEIKANAFAFWVHISTIKVCILFLITYLVFNMFEFNWWAICFLFTA